LKVDADTCRGTREGVPRLAELFARYGARASFLFSLGPDHTGRAIRRALRPGFFGKVRRTSVLEHYGLRTLLYGTLLPGPDIGLACAAQMRAVRAAGFETGVHCWDHVRWQDGVPGAGEDWTRAQMERSLARYTEVLGEPPRVHGAAGWQMNVHAFRLLERLGFEYASDTRGSGPFVPVWKGEPFACPQLPTTLPTLDELIGTGSITAASVASHLLALSREAPPAGHVYTLHAELEGGKLLPVMEALLSGWKDMGYELVALGDLAQDLSMAALPRHEVVSGSLAGRSGTMALQGREFLVRHNANAAAATGGGRGGGPDFTT
ncbi:MAG: polysaccharide deacetylase family protein, partial [Burkholderiales bacterium]|nr:polysaccharide deacetylase family protein [Burkholderiales bacterium]